ncbi:hypothetical protein [Pseudoalteromonas sp. NBT06-2]|uniref:hypothetical protein n=1 Tax=Pseudoalteromonas sp. NBT06-2 TaxID=2025950 RepID=UPI0020752721|nr:hypothetical protein [Pseudoalteromonas sp. NBT06-2]
MEKILKQHSFKAVRQKILYPNHFKMQDSVGIRNALGKALIEEHGYSLFKINNAA